MGVVNCHLRVVSRFSFGGLRSSDFAPGFLTHAQRMLTTDAEDKRSETEVQTLQDQLTTDHGPLATDKHQAYSVVTFRTNPQSPLALT